MELFEQEKITNDYYRDNAKKLRTMVKQILTKLGFASLVDKDDFYSLANEVFVDVLKRYDSSQSFEGFLYSCLTNRFKTEMTRRNRKKRIPDKMSISLETPIGEDGCTLGDIIQSDFNIESEIEKSDSKTGENVEKYLASLTKTQREIVELKMKGVSVPDIKTILNLTDKQYKIHFKGLKSFEKLSLLCGNNNDYKTHSKTYSSNKNNQEYKGDNMMQTQTMEKSKPDRMSVSSIIKKIDKHTIRFDHPLQRESEQWSPSMKSNLISDILQGNPIPALVFAEQIVNGIAIIWDLDGKQRCTNVYSFVKNTYKISKNVRRFMIEYQAPIIDEKGDLTLDNCGFPIYEMKMFDIRGNRFSDLPEELKDKLYDYNFEIEQYLNCSSEDIAYHIARYNEGKSMTAPQKGITRLGEEYAGIVKAISNMTFFKDMGGYKVSEFKNGTVNRVVVESVMVINFLDNWKKTQEDMCEFLKEKADVSDFDEFEEMVCRIEDIVRGLDETEADKISDMFNSKDSFLWFGLFAKFIDLNVADKTFTDFMIEFAQSLHNKKINGVVSYDDLKGSNKDKNVVIGKMTHLEKLMLIYLGINKKDTLVDDVLVFVQENINQNTTYDDIKQYEKCLYSLTADMRDNENIKLLDKQNRLSLIAIIAYAKEVNLSIKKLKEWLIIFFDENRVYIKDPKESFLYIKQFIDYYIAATVKAIA